MIADEAELLIRLLPDGPKLVKGAESAFYIPSADAIYMPSRGAFISDEAYISTLMHEAVHAMGHPSRLGRYELGKTGKLAGIEAYTQEELVAEVGAAFVCSEIGVECQIPNSAAYLRGWLEAIKADPTMVVKAASDAEKSADMIFRRHKPK